MSEDGSERYWGCPKCGDTRVRHPNATKSPFCDECEFRDALLVEMEVKGDDPELRTDGGVDHDGSEQDLWERIKEFNAHFDYKRGDELGLWAMIMRKQVEEIDEHLDNGENEKAINEFIDCVLVGQQAVLLATDEDVDEVLMDRIVDIEARVDDVEKSYRDEYEREVVRR